MAIIKTIVRNITEKTNKDNHYEATILDKAWNNAAIITTCRTPIL